MAIFKSSTGINQVQDKAVKNYLMELNENLTYMFQNLTPDDNNAASVPKLTYVQDGESAGRFEISANGITAQLTDADNIVATINMSSEGIAIAADKISIEGLVTANENFWIDEEGSMGAKNGTFSGTITASQMSSSTITLGGSGSSGSMTVLNSTGARIGGWDADGIYVNRGELSVGELIASDDITFFGCFKAYTDNDYHYLALQDETVGMGDHENYAFWAGSASASPPFRVNQKGKLYCSDMGSDWSGYSVGEAIKWIWDNWPDSGA